MGYAKSSSGTHPFKQMGELCLSVTGNRHRGNLQQFPKGSTLRAENEHGVEMIVIVGMNAEMALNFPGDHDEDLWRQTRDARR